MNIANSAFQHQPLDHTKPTIRLVQILPELSPDGYIQCTIFHATITASYACLSYTWGEPDPSTSKTILMNDSPFTVRRNLFDFLQLMQSSYEQSDTALRHAIRKHYWIDALCIDQSNTSERNHQVTQMGKIFSQAIFVHVWLGMVPHAERICHLLMEAPEGEGLDAWLDIFKRDRHLLVRYIFQNEYWDRAWVTQEIMLALCTLVSLGSQTFYFQHLFQNSLYFRPDLCGTSCGQFSFNHYSRANRVKSILDILGRDLLFLLWHFRDKKCSIPQDRAYSLLSLGPQPSNIQVDYGVRASDLAFQILDAHPKQVCFCSAIMVAQSLDVQAIPDDVIQAGIVLQQPCLEVHIRGFQTRWDNGLTARGLALGHYETSKMWPDRFRPPRGAYFGKCVDEWLRELFGRLDSNEQLKDYFMRKFSIHRPTSLSEAITEFPWSQDRWTSLAPGWKIAVYDETRNICAVRITLGTLRQVNIKHVLCSTPKPWYKKNYDGPIERIHIVYDT